MLGLPGIVQEARQGPAPPGPRRRHRHRLRPEPSAERPARPRARTPSPGNLYLADADQAAIDVKNGGKYVVRRRPTPGVDGGRGLARGRRRGRRAASHRLFGFFGTTTLDHLPFRTADGRLRPAPTGIERQGRESTPPPTSTRHPTLADMTDAALTVLAGRPGPAVRPVRRGRRRRLRPPRQQPRQRHRRRLQRRGGGPGDHRLGRDAQQLGRLGPDRLLRPRPLPRPRRPQGPGRGQMTLLVRRESNGDGSALFLVRRSESECNGARVTDTIVIAVASFARFRCFRQVGFL